jgi:hypothetical protein
MHPLPFAFLERIRQQFPSEAELMIAALDNSPTASIRINKMKPGALFEKIRELNCPGPHQKFLVPAPNSNAPTRMLIFD